MMNPFTLSAELRQELESAIEICREHQYQFELYNVYTNFEQGTPKHEISVSEQFIGSDRGVIAARGIRVNGAFDTEIIGGDCGNCVGGRYEMLKFRITGPGGWR